MKTKKLLLVPSLLAAMSFSGMANAEALSDSVTINFTGVFQNTTCSINFNNTDVSGNGSVDLNLGAYTTNTLTTDADATVAVPFAVNFSECGGISEAHVAFSGTQTQLGLFDVDGNNKNSVGVGINAATTKGDYIAIGDKTNIVIKDGNGSAEFYARYVKIGDTELVEDQANAVATMDITYG